MHALKLSSSTRRMPTGLLIVAGLHVAFIWTLASGLKVRWSPEPTPPDIQARVIPQEPIPVIEPNPPANPTRMLTQVDVRPPGPVHVTEDPPVQILNERDSPAPGLTGGSTEVAPPPPVIMTPAVDPRRPLTQPAYPPASVRLNEEGSLALEVLVGTDGHIKSTRIARSSGFERLDQAAIEEARHRWQLRPATRDGVPFEQWYTLKVVFRLEGRR